MVTSPRLLVLWIMVGCAEPGQPDPVDEGGGELDRAETPPMGHAAVAPWLAEGHYLGWTCEDAAHPARPPGAHGANRICSNLLLSSSDTGAYPIGAASVKELYTGSAISGYAVGRKLTAGTDAASWYWYERIGTSTVADSAGAGLCAGCHEDAARDHVFTQVR